MAKRDVDFIITDDHYLKAIILPQIWVKFVMAKNLQIQTFDTFYSS